jgi:hypothetical protein
MHQGAGHATDRAPGPVLLRARTARYLGPAALDRQWLVYSDKSTCADRAGGDGVAALRLNSSQIAWFFSDTSLGPAGPHIGLSKESGFVHNLVVMQTIRGSRSALVTITGGDACPGPGRPGHARSVVNPGNAGGPSNQPYWGGDGLRIGSRVLRFYSRYRPGALIPVGTVIASFSVRQLSHEGRGPAYGEVIRPAITKLPTYVPPGGGTPIVWGAAVLRQGDTVYIYGWQTGASALPMLHCYLARVAAARLTEVSTWQFYAGNGRWATGQESAQPLPAAAGLSLDTGFSVIRAAGRYWLIEQAGGLGGTDIDAYPSPAPWGPFQTASAIVLYSAPGIGLTATDHYQIMYLVQAEPTISTKRTLLISYNVTSLAVTAGCVPLSAFTNAAIQPRFVAVPWADFGATPGQARPTATAGPSAYPLTAGTPDPHWYDSWTYRGGCPPLQAVGDLSVTHAKDLIRISWHAAGPGVKYQIYLRSPGTSYVLLRTVHTSSVTLRNLNHGIKYQVLIIEENTRKRTGPATSITVAAP